MKKRVVFSGLVLVILIAIMVQGCGTGRAKRKAKRVILIGIDGMSSDGFQRAKTPNLDSLINNGAVSLHTRAVMPTVSAPNWAAILTGAGPEQNGVIDNGWTVGNSTVDPVEKDGDGYFPSAFKLIKEKYPESKTGMFYDWKELGNLFNKKYIDKEVLTERFGSQLELASKWISENDPVFSFIYLGSPDDYGNKYGWMSKKYIERIEETDKLLGTFFNHLRKAGMFEDTYFIVVSDHGGLGKEHGGLSREEIEVPWIISGPETIKNKVIKQPNNVFNTASTVLYLLGIEQPYSWIGKPVLGAFAWEKEFSGLNTNGYVPKPYSTVTSGIYEKAQLAKLMVSQSDCSIHFTVDGSEPDLNSPMYKEPFLLLNTMVYKAAAFKENAVSEVLEIDFKRTIQVKSISLEYPPQDKYSGLGAYSLINLKTGTDDFKDKEWLGFNGDDLVATLFLGDFKKLIHSVSIGFLKDEDNRIFMPSVVDVYTSVYGKKFKKVPVLNIENHFKNPHKGRNEVEITFSNVSAKYVKVVAKNHGICPGSHPDNNEKCWLFVDEIRIE